MISTGFDFIYTAKGISSIIIRRDDPHAMPLEVLRSGVVIPEETDDNQKKVAHQLEEYLSGKRTTFNLKLDLQGTPFQLKVWKALQSIPYGVTATYQDIANKIKQPKAVRAVANAIGANPVAIIIPCHRIIRSDGSLGGYRGGVEKKLHLLKIEALYNSAKIR
jgi:O-6-methylguanine DNA methyltransferase